ncbi:efflux RND transporter periplasmic adaptor subunit [Rhizobium sp. CRIBSB]|nr:efflux RND transporter periplasmic adaptor subunit [Rhizobium sp. CRIBSB]
MRKTSLLLLSLAAIALSSCSEAEQTAEQQVRPVLSIVAGPRVDEPGSSFAGTVEAKLSVDIGFRLLGRVTARMVDVGDVVHAGQVLMTLDTTSLDLAVRQAEADLASAKAKLELAEVNARRQETLLKTQATTKERLEEAEQTAEAAEATLRQEEADLTKAREQTSYATITAETDGVVSAIDAEVGQVVAAGQTVVTVARLEALDAVIDIPDTLQALQTVGAEYQVTLLSNPQVNVKGRVRETLPEADPVTRTRRTKIALDAPGTAFRLGSTVMARPVEPVASSIWLPENAIGTTQDGSHFVWVIDAASSTVVRRPVELSASLGGGSHILSGVEAGERVVTAGVNSLADNQIVSLTDEIAQ